MAMAAGWTRPRRALARAHAAARVNAAERTGGLAFTGAATRVRDNRGVAGLNREAVRVRDRSRLAEARSGFRSREPDPKGDARKNELLSEKK
jgi:hypothetical protein